MKQENVEGTVKKIMTTEYVQNELKGICINNSDNILSLLLQMIRSSLFNSIPVPVDWGGKPRYNKRNDLFTAAGHE